MLVFGGLVMSPAVESAIAPAPPDMETLARKLVELRGEIDAILVQLAALSRPEARQCAAPAAETTAGDASTSFAPVDAVPAAMAATAAPEETPAGIETEAAGGETAPGPQASAGEDAREAATPEPSSDAEPAAEEPTKPTTGLTAALAACQSVAIEEPALAPIDADAMARGPETPTTEDAIPADTTAARRPTDAEPEAIVDAQAVSAAEVADDAGAPTTPTCEVPAAAEKPVAAAAAETAPDIAPEPAAADVPAPEAEAPAATAAAVISFEPRQRKTKADLVAPKPEAAPRRRRVVSRIAAGIVALIAAASALVLADREALGGPQTLPWVSPLPSYRMPWSVFTPQRRAESAGDTLSTVGEAREIWPVSP
jgi:hypothetical protein